jgi:hypothetical protein
MNKLFHLANMLGMAAVVATAPVQAGDARTSAPDAAHRHAEAVRAFATQRYADAYGRFAELADQGDGASALIALMLVCEGPSMFGSPWSATPGQLQRWSAMAVRHVGEIGLLIADHDRGE